MTEPAKNAQGLKGFPTPNTATGEFTYLLFYLDDPLWAQYILGAIRTLESEYNWYQAGDLMPDEASEAFRLINQAAPTNKLPVCSLPTGEPLMRVNPTTGHIQSVDADSNWEDNPDIPPTPERPSGAPDDQRCDAAANTANALEILYENLTDSWSHGLTVAEAITAFVVAVGETIAAAFFPPAAALIAALGLIFEAVYATIEFVGADVWTTDFTDVLRCYLYDCSSVDANVVTYDFQCIIDKLVAHTDAAGLSDTQLRLFGQLYYILNFIGVDGLNYAGAATTITGADCSDCGDTFCESEHFAVDDYGWSIVSGEGGTYTGGVGFVGTNLNSGNNTDTGIEIVIAPTQLTYVRFHAIKAGGAGANDSAGMRLWDGATLVYNGLTGGGTTGDYIYTFGSPTIIDKIQMFVNAGSSGAATGVTDTHIEGLGTNPFSGIKNNCDD